MEKLMDSFINNCGNSFLQYFERYRYKNLINREDYKALYDKKQTIFNEFPNVRTFLQDRMIIELTDDEKDAILRLLEIDEEIEKIDSIYPELRDIKDPFKYQKYIKEPGVIEDYLKYIAYSLGNYEQDYKDYIARRAEEMQFAKIGIPEEQYAYFIDNFDERRLKDTLKIIRNNTFRMKNQALKNEPLPLADYVNIVLFVSPLNTEGRDLVQKRYCIPTEEEAREIINALIDVVIEQDIERGQVYDVFGNYRKTSYDSRNIPSYFEMMGIQDKYKLTEQAQFPNIPKIQKEVSKKYPNLK